MKWILLQPPFRIWHTAVSGKIRYEFTAVQCVFDAFGIIENSLISEPELFVAYKKRRDPELRAPDGHAAVPRNHQIRLDSP
jgi:hypothetical protein